MSNQQDCIATIQIPFKIEPLVPSTKANTQKHVWVSDEHTSPEASPQTEYFHDPPENLPGVVRFIKELKNAVFPNIGFVSHHNAPSCHDDYQVLIEYGLKAIKSAEVEGEVETSAHVLDELVKETRKNIPKEIRKLMGSLCAADGSNFVQSLLAAYVHCECEPTGEDLSKMTMQNDCDLEPSRVWKIDALFQYIFEFVHLSDVFGLAKRVCKSFRFRLSTLPNENSCGRRILKNRWNFSKKESVLTELDALTYERGTEPDHAFSFICCRIDEEKPPDIHWLVNILRACMLGHRQASHHLLEKFTDNNKFYDELVTTQQYYEQQFDEKTMQRVQELHPYRRSVSLPTTLLALNSNWAILNQICTKLSVGNLNFEKALFVDDIIYDLFTVSPAKEALGCWEVFLEQGWIPGIVGACNEWGENFDVLHELNSSLKMTFPECEFLPLSRDEEISKRVLRKEDLAKSMQDLSHRNLLPQRLDQWVNSARYVGYIQNENYDLALETVGVRIQPLM